MRSLLGSVFLLALLSGAPQTSFAAPACSFTGIYSNLAVDKGTGDISGYEITITISPEGHEAIYTQAEGNFPIKPIVSDTKILNEWITFQVKVGKNTLNVKAKPTCKYLEAHFEWSTGSKYMLHLPRKKSFWDTSSN